MDNWYYYYKIKIYNELAGKEEIVEGITYGTTCGNAVERIANYYGDIIDIYHCKYLGSGGDCIELEELKDFFNESKKEKED